MDPQAASYGFISCLLVVYLLQLFCRSLVSWVLVCLWTNTWMSHMVNTNDRWTLDCDKFWFTGRICFDSQFLVLDCPVPPLQPCTVSPLAPSRLFFLPSQENPISAALSPHHSSSPPFIPPPVLSLLSSPLWPPRCIPARTRPLCGARKARLSVACIK